MIALRNAHLAAELVQRAISNRNKRMALPRLLCAPLALSEADLGVESEGLQSLLAKRREVEEEVSQLVGMAPLKAFLAELNAKQAAGEAARLRANRWKTFSYWFTQGGSAAALLGMLLWAVAGAAFLCLDRSWLREDAQECQVVDAFYFAVVTSTTVGYGDLVPQDTSHKLYTMVFMPLAATTLAATVERFDKLNAAQRIHRTNFRLVADNMLREEAIAQQTAAPQLSAEAFVLRVLVEENLVEEATINELRGRFHGMLAQGKGLMHGAGRVDRDGVPKAIDAEVVFFLLVQQGRIVDSNASADDAGGRAKEERWLLGLLGMFGANADR